MRLNQFSCLHHDLQRTNTHRHTCTHACTDTQIYKHKHTHTSVHTYTQTRKHEHTQAFIKLGNINRIHKNLLSIWTFPEQHKNSPRTIIQCSSSPSQTYHWLKCVQKMEKHWVSFFKVGVMLLLSWKWLVFLSTVSKIMKAYIFSLCLRCKGTLTRLCCWAKKKTFIWLLTFPFGSLDSPLFPFHMPLKEHHNDPWVVYAAAGKQEVVLAIFLFLQHWTNRSPMVNLSCRRAWAIQQQLLKANFYCKRNDSISKYPCNTAKSYHLYIQKHLKKITRAKLVAFKRLETDSNKQPTLWLPSLNNSNHVI